MRPSIRHIYVKGERRRRQANDGKSEGDQKAGIAEVSARRGRWLRMAAKPGAEDNRSSSMRARVKPIRIAFDLRAPP
jgi:hypothetical protein